MTKTPLATDWSSHNSEHHGIYIDICTMLVNGLRLVVGGKCKSNNIRLTKIAFKKKKKKKKKKFNYGKCISDVIIGRYKYYTGVGVVLRGSE